MSKRIVSKAMLHEITQRLEVFGYEFSKKSSCSEINVFKKDLENIRVGFHYSVNGRGSYDAFGTIKIIYKDLTEILFKLFDNSSFAADYNLNNEENVWLGVGIQSNIGRSASDKTVYRCSSEEEAEQFSLNFSDQIKSAEENFVLPHTDVAVTIKEFKKPSHALWPGPLKVFLEHLVSLGIKNSDPEIITYAFQKADDVCKKISPHPSILEFIENLKQRVELLEFMKAACNDGEV